MNDDSPRTRSKVGTTRVPTGVIAAQAQRKGGLFVFEPFRKDRPLHLLKPLEATRGGGHESSTATLTRSTDCVPRSGSEALHVASGSIRYPHSRVPPPRVGLAVNGRQRSRNQGSRPVAFLDEAPMQRTHDWSERSVSCWPESTSRRRYLCWGHPSAEALSAKVNRYITDTQRQCCSPFLGTTSLRRVNNKVGWGWRGEDAPQRQVGNQIPDFLASCKNGAEHTPDWLLKF